MRLRPCGQQVAGQEKHFADRHMRIGVDLGGTKIEALALDEGGRELLRRRISTPRGDYPGTLNAIRTLVEGLEGELGAKSTVGMGIPGSVRAAGPMAGLVKNANSTWLNGQALQRDISAAMGREVRVANDANCLAVSEATDGAAAGLPVVFAVILGTGCGGGVAFAGGVHGGPNGVAGEWGHTPLPWATAEETPGPPCYCGRSGCMEQWVAGPAAERDYTRHSGRSLALREIVALSETGDAAALAALDRLESRLARGLAAVIDVLDPDVLVLGGGLSQIGRLYANLPGLLPRWVFGGECETRILPAKFGDSSGVRGAAWLWPAG